MDADLERILTDGYLVDMTDCDVATVRERRAECQRVETQLSYLRRLVQGRHDIVVAELDRRSSGGDPGDVTSLVEQLPEILSDRVRGPGSGRLPASIEPTLPSGRLVTRLESIDEAVPLDRPDALGDADLVRAEADLAGLEQEVSSLRRTMFDRIDALETELTGRYASGAATVDDLLRQPDR